MRADLQPGRTVCERIQAQFQAKQRNASRTTRDPATETRKHYLHHRSGDIPWLYPGQATLSEDSIAILRGLQWKWWAALWFSPF
jgi:hypothetical protein